MPKQILVGASGEAAMLQWGMGAKSQCPQCSGGGRRREVTPALAEPLAPCCWVLFLPHCHCLPVRN